MLETKQHQRVFQIALNNPANGNVLDIELCNQLLEELDRAEGDRSVSAILLTANGPDFCVGMDLKEQLEAGTVQLGGRRRCVSTRMRHPVQKFREFFPLEAAC